MLALQVAQQFDDLLLHLPVKRRRRLVQHHQLRLEDDRSGDGDALALPAGKFVRIAVAHGGIEPDLGKRRGSRARARARSCAGSCTIRPSVTIWPPVMRGDSEPNGS